MAGNLQRRIDDLISVMNYETDDWRVSGSYHSIKATARDFETYNIPFDKRKIRELDIKYMDWQHKQNNTHNLPNREFAPPIVIIQTIKESKNKNF
jgi:hypothetical protein